MTTLTRRHVLFAGLGVASAGALTACGGKTTATSAATSSPLTIPSQTPMSPAPGGTVVNHALTPRTVCT